MPGKVALVDFSRCQPQHCGICPAVAACPRKLIFQESRGSIPMTNPAVCCGCGDCARACPLKAITVLAQ